MAWKTKKICLLALLFFCKNSFALTEEFICTYNVTFLSNPYDSETYKEKNPKLSDYKQKIIIDVKKKLVTREYFNIEWDGKKKIKVKQQVVSPISTASRDLNVPNKLIYWFEETSEIKGISDGQVNIYSLATWIKTTLTHSYISVVSAYDTHYNCITNG